MPDSSSAARDRTRPGGIATRLRDLRVAAGLSGKGLADALGWTPHKVSKVEHGRQLIKATELTAWIVACGRGADAELLDMMTKLLTGARAVRPSHGEAMAAMGMADQQRYYDRRVDEAGSVLWFEPAQIPGFVQTEGYARQILTGVADRYAIDTTQLDEAVAVRAGRIQKVYAEPTKFTVLVAEPALLWRPYRMPAATMITQLERLLTLLDVDGLRFAIVPLGAELEAGLPEPLTLYDESILVVEGLVDDDESIGGPKLDQFVAIIEALDQEAVTDGQAQTLIMAAIDRAASQRD